MSAFFEKNFERIFGQIMQTMNRNKVVIIGVDGVFWNVTSLGE